MGNHAFALKPIWSTFRLFYSFAFLFQLGKSWSDLYFISFTMLLIIYQLWETRESCLDYGFFGLLTLSTVKILQGFPDLANHENVYLIINFYLIYLLRPIFNPKFQANIEESKISLKMTLAIIYIMTGFHKLNYDFLNPEVSCGIEFAREYLKFSHPLFINFSFQKFFLIAIVLFEIVLGFMLFFNLLFPLTLIFALIFHGLLAPLGFGDFFVFIQGLWILFLSNNNSKFSSPKKLKNKFLILLLISIILGAIRIQSQAPTAANLEGVLLILFSFLFWTPLIKEEFKLNQSLKASKALFKGLGDTGAFALPLILLCFTLMPYFGLRTAGVLNMFSNLRTEQRSNHILLNTSKMKLWNYQEDIVWINYLPDKARPGPKFPKNGEGLPAIEFLKYLDYLKSKNFNSIPAILTYQGKQLKLPDITQSPEFIYHSGHSLKGFMQFRKVQKSGPEYCKW